MLLSKITSVVSDAFSAAGFDGDDPKVKVSDRPELSDFQSNGAMGLAKKLGQNPREIADKIRHTLTNNGWFDQVTVDGPGFINMTVKDHKLVELLPGLLTDPRMTVPLKDHPETVVMDYPSPNVAKAMHVGHLRISIIGEAIKRLFRFVGDTFIADNHLGDWGKPMGLIIESLRERSTKGQLTVKELEELYPVAVARAKEDPAFLERALKATKMLQDGDPDTRKMWEEFTKLSIDDINATLAELDVSTDVLFGESSMHERLQKLSKRLIESKQAVLDDGAYIISFGEDMPPFILVKSDGAFMYAGTDLAKIEDRIERFHADRILYLTDNRQSLHFKQLFGAARQTGIAAEDKVGLEFLAVGTVNGKDDKPFKTRDGGVMTLKGLIDMAKEASRSKTEDPKVADQIALTALKFADLMNDRSQSYIFDLDKFLLTEGKTGPYVLYAAVRIHAILDKAGNFHFDPKKGLSLSTPLHPSERALLLHLFRLPETIYAAYDKRAPHVLVEHLFVLAQLFSTFYHDCHVLNEENEEIKHFRLCLLSAVYKEMHLLCGILGFAIPDKM